MAYSPMTYEQFTTGYSNLANLNEQNALNKKLTDNTNNLQSLTSQLNQGRQNVNNQYQTGLNTLEAAKNKQLPQYVQTSNATDAQTRQAAQRLSEIMYSRGLGRSGGALTGLGNIYAQGNANLSNIYQDRSNFLGEQTNQANQLAAQQATGLSDIDRQIALAQVQAAQAEQQARTEYANNVAAAPLQAALNYPSLYSAQTEQSANLLATLLNYNIENNKLQGAVQTPSGFKYGDSMIALLQQLGVLQ